MSRLRLEIAGVRLEVDPQQVQAQQAAERLQRALELAARRLQRVVRGQGEIVATIDTLTLDSETVAQLAGSGGIERVANELVERLRARL